MRDSQVNMYEHSEAKVQLLRMYVERYLSILALAKSVEEVYLFDLFCGVGVYENGGIGSPIVFLESINKLPEKHLKNIKFDVHFNDSSEEKIKKLRNEIIKGNYSRKIESLEFSSIDYQKILPIVFSKLNGFRKKRGFIFIDPYGYKEVRFSHIKTLLKAGNTEILLFLPTQFMFRFENKATPESLIDFINDIVPKEEHPRSNTGIEFIENLKISFRKNLDAKTFVDSFIITRNKNQFYCLFYFTSHIYGFDRMLDVKWKIDEEDGRGWRYNTSHDLFSQAEKSANTFRLEKELRLYLEHEFKSNGEIYEFVLHLGFLPKHAMAVLRNFQTEGKLNVKANEPVKSGAFYINYKSYINSPKKVLIKYRS